MVGDFDQRAKGDDETPPLTFEQFTMAQNNAYAFLEKADNYDDVKEHFSALQNDLHNPVVIAEVLFLKDVLLSESGPGGHHFAYDQWQAIALEMQSNQGDHYNEVGKLYMGYKDEESVLNAPDQSSESSADSVVSHKDNKKPSTPAMSLYNEAYLAEYGQD